VNRQPIDYLTEAGIDGSPENQPSQQDIESKEFQAIWGVIKAWDIQRVPNTGYAGATGTDVMRILNALRAVI
jgi:hypothetical protein